MIQNYRDLNRHAGLGVAVREYPTATGPVDYALFVDRKAAGVIEAKRPEENPKGIDDQSQRYLKGFSDDVVRWQKPLPFVYESNGSKTCFRDLRDPSPRQRYVFTFHSPEALLELLHEKEGTLRTRLKRLPPITTDGLRDCQVDALEKISDPF